MNGRFAFHLGSLVVAVVALSGCVSPTVVLEPSIPTIAPSAAPDSARTAPLAVNVTQVTNQASKYEEKSDKILVGKSESLGVHLSDIWMQEPPATFVKRLLEASLKSWGYQVSPAEAQLRIDARVNKFSIDSRAASAIEFQADGAIDADVIVNRATGATLYKGNYRGSCTQRTATQFPSKDYLEALFNRCVVDFQKQLQSDEKLRSALRAGTQM